MDDNEYAYPTIDDYEEIVGFKVCDNFRVGWNMARTTNKMFGLPKDVQSGADRAYKIVGRYSGREQRYAYHGKVGTQAKKAVYTSFSDFKKYAPKTIMRWIKYCDYDVEAYERIDDKWVRTHMPSEAADGN